MAISSMDQMIAAMSAGKTVRYDGNKITGAAAYTAGRWYDMSALNGLPVANAWAGTALTWTPCTETTGNGTQIFGIPNGGNVAADIKHALNLNAWGTAATAVPATLMLVDMEGYYPGINMNVATAQTLLGTPTPRSTNGAGLRAGLVVTATTGATAHNIALSYTNQAGTAGRTLPVTVAGTVSAITPHITHSGVAANNYGPFLPLASGDTGIRSVQTLTLSAASLAGTAALVLYKPITQITISVSGLMTEKDLLNQIPSLPRIADGACLTWILGAGAAVAASTTFNFGTEYVWG
jgi:hypothetical protein